MGVSEWLDRIWTEIRRIGREWLFVIALGVILVLIIYFFVSKKVSPKAIRGAI